MNNAISVPTDSNSTARRAARNAAAIAAASILSKGALFAWQLILAPLLGTAWYGIYGTVGALVAVGAALPAFGMGQIVIRDVARHPENAGHYLAASLFSRTILALAAYIGLVIAASLLGYSEAIIALAALAGLSLIVDTFGNLCFDLLLAQERMIVTSLVDVGHIVLRVGLAALALLAGYGLIGVYVVTIISGVVRSALLWLALMRGGVRPHWPLERAILLPLLANSAPLALSSFLGLAYQHADKLMTTSLLTETDTAYLTAAFVVIFGVVELLSTTILTAIYPMMSRYSEGGDNPAMFGFMVQKIALFTALVSLPITLVISVFAPEGVMVFGDDFRPTADVLSVLIWYALVTMVANVFAQAMMVQNKQRRLLAIRAGGLAVNLVLLAILLPTLGVRGAAVSSVIAEIGVLLVFVADFRAVEWDWRRLLSPLVKLIVLGAGVWLAMTLLRPVHPIIGGTAGMIVYVGGIFVLRVLAADDWALLARIAEAMPGGSLLRRFTQKAT